MVSWIYVTLATLAIVSAFIVVFSPRAAYSALALVVTMLCLAGIFLVIQAPFVALIQILVYAGAIMVLFLYVIMLLNPRHSEPLPEFALARRGSAIFLVAVFFLMGAIWMWKTKPALSPTVVFTAPEIKTIALRLMTDYMLPFELTSILLLVAIVGAVLIAKRD